MIWTLLTSFDPSLLATFIIAGLLLNLTPGADFMFVSASGISGGPKVGMAAGLGVSTGGAIHIIAAAAGVSALLIAYPPAYTAIKYAGAAYLLVLAYQMWNSTPSEGKPALTPAKAFQRGFITNILNPKTMLFIFAFIPQFTDPLIGPIWAQILILGAIFLFNGTLFIVALGAISGVFATILGAHLRVLNKLTAILFGALAARLLID